MAGQGRGGGDGKRQLSAEEAALWAKVAETAEPLEEGDPSPDAPPEPAPSSSAAPRPTTEAYTPIERDRTVTEPELASIGRKEARQIRSGRVEIDARLDLHGLRQREAYGALQSFLANAQANGHRYVLIITGKGGLAPEDEDENFFHERQERGVLKRAVPRWLAEPAFRAWVIGYESAHTRHGGEGALYVRLRRQARR